MPRLEVLWLGNGAIGDAASALRGFPHTTERGQALLRQAACITKLREEQRRCDWAAAASTPSPT